MLSTHCIISNSPSGNLPSASKRPKRKGPGWQRDGLARARPASYRTSVSSFSSMEEWRGLLKASQGASRCTKQHWLTRHWNMCKNHSAPTWKRTTNQSNGSRANIPVSSLKRMHLHWTFSHFWICIQNRDTLLFRFRGITFTCKKYRIFKILQEVLYFQN